MHDIELAGAVSPNVHTLRLNVIALLHIALHGMYAPICSYSRLSQHKKIHRPANHADRHKRVPASTCSYPADISRQPFQGGGVVGVRLCRLRRRRRRRHCSFLDGCMAGPAVVVAMCSSVVTGAEMWSNYKSDRRRE